MQTYRHVFIYIRVCIKYIYMWAVECLQMARDT